MIAVSPLDEARFGIRTAKATDLTEACLPEVLQFCEREGVRLLIARCPASDLRLVHRLERIGFLLMDTLVYYRHQNLAEIPVITDPVGIEIRPIRPGEETQVRSIAEQSFRGYTGHYHADPRLDPKLCDETYSDWALRSCTSRDAADEVLVASSEDGPLGLITLRIAEGEAEGPLLCVAPHARGRGIAGLVVPAMEWSRNHGAKGFKISTQITNLAAQRIFARAGLEPAAFSYTFHRGFD